MPRRSHLKLAALGAELQEKRQQLEELRQNNYTLRLRRAVLVLLVRCLEEVSAHKVIVATTWPRRAARKLTNGCTCFARAASAVSYACNCGFANTQVFREERVAGCTTHRTTSRASVGLSPNRP